MVSVIISFYERLRHLESCLASLALDPRGIDEVVITDDGSSGQTVQALRKILARYPFPIRHVWQPKEGFRVAAARNNGIREAKGEYLIFFDCDFLPLPGTVRVHTGMSRQGRFIAGNCKYLTENQTTNLFSAEMAAERLEELYASIPEKNLLREHGKFRLRSVLFRLHLLPPWKQSLGGHFSIFRKDIETINGYDENFRGWGGEDEDLGIRLVRAGIYCRSAIPMARVLHAWHPKELADKHWREGDNMDYFRRRDSPVRCLKGLDGKMTNSPS